MYSLHHSFDCALYPFSLPLDSLLSYLVFLSFACVLIAATVATFTHACSVANEVSRAYLA